MGTQNVPERLQVGCPAPRRKCLATDWASAALLHHHPLSGRAGLAGHLETLALAFAQNALVVEQPQIGRFDHRQILIPHIQPQKRREKATCPRLGVKGESR